MARGNAVRRKSNPSRRVGRAFQPDSSVRLKPDIGTKAPDRGTNCMPFLRTEMNMHGMNNAARICARNLRPLWIRISPAPWNLRRAVNLRVCARPHLREIQADVIKQHNSNDRLKLRRSGSYSLTKPSYSSEHKIKFCSANEQFVSFSNSRTRTTSVPLVPGANDPSASRQIHFRGVAFRPVRPLRRPASAPLKRNAASVLVPEILARIIGELTGVKSVSSQRRLSRRMEESRRAGMGRIESDPGGSSKGRTAGMRRPISSTGRAARPSTSRPIQGSSRRSPTTR
jgi:hypothetical protein